MIYVKATCDKCGNSIEMDDFDCADVFGAIEDNGFLTHKSGRVFCNEECEEKYFKKYSEKDDD